MYKLFGREDSRDWTPLIRQEIIIVYKLLMNAQCKLMIELVIMFSVY